MTLGIWQDIGFLFEFSSSTFSSILYLKVYAIQGFSFISSRFRWLMPTLCVFSHVIVELLKRVYHVRFFSSWFVLEISERFRLFFKEIEQRNGTRRVLPCATYVRHLPESLGFHVLVQEVVSSFCLWTWK